MGNLLFRCDNSPFLPLLALERIIHYTTELSLRLISNDFNQLVLTKCESEMNEQSTYLSLMQLGEIVDDTRMSLITIDVIESKAELHLYSSGWYLKIFNKFIRLPDIVLINDLRFHFHHKIKNKFEPLVLTNGVIYNLKRQQYLCEKYQIIYHKFISYKPVYDFVTHYHKFIIFSYFKKRDPPYQIELSTSRGFQITKNYHLNREHDFRNQNLFVLGNDEWLYIFDIKKKNVHMINLDYWFVSTFGVIGTLGNDIIFYFKYRAVHLWKIISYNYLQNTSKSFDDIEDSDFRKYSLSEGGITYRNDENQDILIDFPKFSYARNQPILIKSLLS